ncbi:hypothetical protein UFOVP466_92 [uncultured Caudovirales phage]|uniref:Uncharacterized protein n=1 Tax=uncultured Caudovirales phage TaxID=2100421 RepID=A0A6J5Q8X3_9CAUD|nr:hypothetical protein UFOVP466_92 [uncultured Caudovirales phage]CAB4180503.1 hypothetical protein UFOVP1045_39 [uncultured Caudovirales phage]CAB4190701.1 hypothetical protein UFOVP1194_93 [uncultured Caudovirales phage]CAB4221852.1 hypothetical protein UFOVP1641_89 [uncultured Caudovirales phage]
MAMATDAECGEIETTGEATARRRPSGVIKHNGFAAFRRNESADVCPYPSGGETSQERQWWMHGFIAAQVVASCRAMTLEEMLR